MDPTTVTCANCRTKNVVLSAALTPPICLQCQTFLPWITKAVDADFEALTDSKEVVVCVELWAAWAQPSRILGPMLRQVAIERAGQVKLVRVNVEEARRAQSTLEARYIPTVLLFWQGEEITRHTGALQLPALRHWMDQGISMTKNPARALS